MTETALCTSAQGPLFSSHHQVSPTNLEIIPLEEKLNKQLIADFTGQPSGYVQASKEKYLLPAKYRDYAHQFLNLELRPEDTWVVTFPRSGTTWTQELVWLIANDLDYKEAERVPQVQRFPFLEFNVFVDDAILDQLLTENAADATKVAMVHDIARPALEVLQETRGPRFIKTHLPFSLLPPKLLDTCKVVYVARNPKDVAVSFYHLNRLIRTQGYTGDFEKYWDYFEQNLHPWMPYWSHLEEGWQRRNHPNLKFLFYEDMNKDLSGTITQMSQFLHKKMSDEEVTELADHLNIKNFRRNSAVNFDVLRHVGMMNDGEQNFIRKGKTGGWKEEFTPELSARADHWINQHLQLTTLRFPNM